MDSVRTRRKLSHSQNSVGNHSGVGVKTGARSGFSAAVSIHPTGSMMKEHSPSRRAYIKALYEVLRSLYRRAECGATLCGTSAS